MDQSRSSKIASAKLKLKEYQRRKIQTAGSDLKQDSDPSASKDLSCTASDGITGGTSSDQLSSDAVPLFTFPADSTPTQFIATPLLADNLATSTLPVSGIVTSAVITSGTVAPSVVSTPGIATSAVVIPGHQSPNRRTQHGESGETAGFTAGGAGGEDSLTSSFIMSTPDGASSGSASRHSEWEYVNNAVSARADPQINQQDVIESVATTTESVSSDNIDDCNKNDLTLPGSPELPDSPESSSQPITTTTTKTAAVEVVEGAGSTASSPYETLCRLNERLIRMTDECDADETNPVLAELRSRLAASDQLKQQLQIQLDAINIDNEKNQLKAAGQLQQLQQANAQLNSNNRQLIADNKQLTIENQQLICEKQTLTVENQDLRAEIQKQQQQQQQLLSENQQIISANQQIISANQQLLSENQHLEQQIKQLVTAEADNQQNRAREQTEQLQHQLALSENSLKAALQDATSLRQQLQSRDLKEAEEKAVISTESVDLGRLNVELLDTRAALSASALANKQLRQQLDSLHVSHAEAEAKLANLQQQQQMQTAAADDSVQYKQLVEEQCQQLQQQAERIQLLESVMTDQEKKQQQKQQQREDSVAGDNNDDQIPPVDCIDTESTAPVTLERALCERAELRARLRQLIAGGAVEVHVHEKLRREMVRLEEQLHSCRAQLADSERLRTETEHVCEQLRSETDTIGEYVSVYRTQRAALQRKAAESNRHIEQLHSERDQLRQQLKQLQLLMNRSQQREEQIAGAERCGDEDKHLESSDTFAVCSEADRAETARRIVELVDQLDSCRLEQKQVDVPASCAHVCHHCRDRPTLEV